MTTLQVELFGAPDLFQPAPKKVPWPAPVPENIRRHLERMLSDAPTADGTRTRR